ncbi:unnamed protein product [Caenorhabditis auriculariae]|uniref:Metallo-beta-lactamase domain-containing protein 1 n=1 Tax=Caenorhabditis auriculariae TaxID=2777116 RepID=A0A8S1GV77_9PELO|nr:unnamed protein product [Caenorhabditis auriculariae]
MPIVILIFLICTVACQDDYILSRESVQQLDDWELRVLRDFVRGKGRPILERIPLDVSDDGMESLLDLTNPMLVPQGGMMMKVQPEPRLLTPKPKSNAPRPSVDDYKQLASMFIDRRTSKPRTRPKEVRLPSVKPIRSRKPLPNAIITAPPEDELSPRSEFPANNEAKLWKPMQRFTPPKTAETSAGTRELYEKRMEELSAELSKIMKKIEEASKNDSPRVHILRNGSAEQINTGEYIFIASVTLIRDRDVNILVDTGLGTNINARTALLETFDLSPPSINVVVTTHGHPDHAGGVHDFPDAVHYHSWFSHHRTRFNLTALFENEYLNLTENVSLVKVRGHTSEDVAVIVRNEPTLGTVFVSGDIFMRSEDLDHPMMWQPLSSDVAAQKEARRKFGCISDWIVPGHGPANRRKPALVIAAVLRSRYRLPMDLPLDASRLIQFTTRHPQL